MKKTIKKQQVVNRSVKYYTKYTSLGKWIKHLCIDYDISVNKFANKIGIGVCCMSEMCKGRKPIPYNFKDLVKENFELTEEQERKLADIIENEPSVILYQINHLAYKLNEEDIKMLKNIIEKHTQEV